MITEFEADVLSHTIRNGRYVTDEAKVIKMGVDGLLEDFGPQKLADGMHYFTVTLDGRLALAEWRESQPKPPKPPKLTRSQNRYRAFLNSDNGLTFAEFLKIKK